MQIFVDDNHDHGGECKGEQAIFLYRGAVQTYKIDSIAVAAPLLQQRKMDMATVLRHRKVNIVVLDTGEPIAGRCRPGDIAILPDDAGWWTKFVGQAGQVDCYEQPYRTYNEALWAAKAAAEFGLD